MKTQMAAIVMGLVGISAGLISGCATSNVSQSIHRVAERGDTATVMDLLQHGADPNAPGRQGWTSLHHAAYSGQPEVARILLNAGAKMEVKDPQGFTPLHWAVYESVGSRGAAESARLFIGRGTARSTLGNVGANYIRNTRAAGTLRRG